MLILTFLVNFLYLLFPLKVIVAVYLPFLVNLVILNVAFPLVLVLALKVFLYFLPLIVKYTQTFDIFLVPDFSVTVYFLTLTLLLKVFLDAVIVVFLGFTFVDCVCCWS